MYENDRFRFSSCSLDNDVHLVTLACPLVALYGITPYVELMTFNTKLSAYIKYYWINYLHRELKPV